MDSTSIRIAELTWPEYAARVSAGPVVFVPVGALEQHGRHLPLATDALIAEKLAERVAARLDGLVLPTVPYGARSLARSGGGDQFPGTVNLDGPTLISLVRDIVREQGRHGVTRIVALLGHGENDPFVIEGAELARRDIAAAKPRVLILGWWQSLTPGDLAPLFPAGFPGWDLEHAARVETALMLALAADHVRHEQIGPIDPVAAPPYIMLPTADGSVPSQGSLADPRGVSAVMGQELVGLIVDRLARTVTTMFSSDR